MTRVKVFQQAQFLCLKKKNLPHTYSKQARKNSLKFEKKTQSFKTEKHIHTSFIHCYGKLYIECFQPKNSRLCAHNIFTTTITTDAKPFLTTTLLNTQELCSIDLVFRMMKQTSRDQDHNCQLGSLRILARLIKF